MLSLPFHQLARQDDLFGLSSLAGDEVVVGVNDIELFDKGLADAGAFLVDGVFRWVGDVADAFLYVAFDDTVGDLLVDVEELTAILPQLFEDDAFGVSQEEQEHGFGEGRHGDLRVVVVGEEDAVFLVDHQSA